MLTNSLGEEQWALLGYTTWPLGTCQLLLHWRPILEVVVQSLSCVQLFATPWTAARQTPLSSIISQSLLKFMSIESVMLSSHLFLCCPLLLFAFNLSQSQGLFQWAGSSYQLAKLLEFQLQYQSFQWRVRVDFLWNWLVWSPCCSRDSQESSPAPQFESISSSVLSHLYGLALTSVLEESLDSPLESSAPLHLPVCNNASSLWLSDYPQFSEMPTSLKWRADWCSIIVLHHSKFRPHALLEMKEHVWVFVIEF